MTRRLAAAALAATALAGCYTIRYERRSVLPEPGAARERWHHGILGGTFLASGPVDLAAMCPYGVAAVESQVSAANWFAQLITSGGGLGLLSAPVGGFALLWAPLWEPTTVRVTCARAGAARSGRAMKIVLLPLAALGGVPKETAQLLGDALAGELRKRPGISVLTPADVSALLGVEKTRQMMGCTESGCMAEIGGALGADRVVHGSLGRIGGSLVVNVSALDPRRAVAAASVSERLRGGREEAFLDVLPSIADALLAEGPAASGGPR
jgi:hypothetical protein